ncbi:MAG: hypothetical protein HJJLKODD_01556 [Phycisphaerae bacterium]|nr:hypothetical protein [Phycisphaerae bacterium]
MLAVTRISICVINAGAFKMVRPLKISIGSVISCVVLLSGCLQPGTTATTNSGLVAVQVMDGAWRVPAAMTGNLACPIYDPVNNRLRVRAARAETIGFGVVYTADKMRLTNLTVQADALSGPAGTLDAGLIQFYRVLPVTYDRFPGWQIKTYEPNERTHNIPDVLIPSQAPREGQPYRLNSGEMLLMWVDIEIPIGTPPGQYNSRLQLASGTTSLREIPLSLEVMPQTLPADVQPALVGPVNLPLLLGHHLSIDGEPYVPERILRDAPLYNESVALVHETLRLLQAHRITPVLTQLYPLSKLDERGELTLDWQDYDQLVGALLDGELYPQQQPQRYWMVPFDEKFPTPPAYDPLSSPSYTRTVLQYLTLVSEHFEQRGWLEQAVLFLPWDKQWTDSAINRTRLYAGMARRAAPNLSLLAELPPQNLQPFGWQDYPNVELGGYVDIWCPPAQFYDPQVFNQPQLRSARKWLKLDRPPYSGSISLSATDTVIRLTALQAGRLGAEAVLLPEINHWTSDFQQRDVVSQLAMNPPPLLLPGEFCGLATPVPTLRLKLLRQGIQDLAWMQLAREHSPESSQLVETLQQFLVRRGGAQAYGVHLASGVYDGWQRETVWWNYARDLLIDLLNREPSGAHPDIAAVLQDIPWQRFLDANQQVTLQSYGSRIQLHAGGTGPARQFQIELLLAINNQSLQPIRARIDFGALPIGWSSSPASPVQLVLPMSTQPITLTATAESIATGPDGVLYVPVMMNVNDGEAITSQVRVTHLTARRLRTPPVLDGDLADWPIGVGNVVGNFTSISQSAVRSTALPVREPQDVIGFVAMDDHDLYFAFHCFTPDRLETAATQRNFVTYEDRLPIGEELLEILIDSSNSGSRAPSDLYHLVIKPNGSVMAERGLRCWPQIGPISDWAAQVEVATRILDDRWIAEIRLPLNSLGDRASGVRSWGINFARFNLQTWDYSTWSGAQWDAYDPLSLGNMSLVD